MSIRETSRFACLLFIPILALAGCGSSNEEGVIIEGKILLNGKPLEAPRRDVGIGVIQARLVPIDGGEPESSMVAEDGTFRIVGPGDGIKPGAYKLVISQQGGPHSEMLEQKFSEQTTPIKVNALQEKIGDTVDLGVIELSDPPKSL